MATGKTTIGTLLAKKLGRVFFDVDTAIEHRTGLTIPRIFANHSEPFFRAIEKGICHEVSLQKNLSDCNRRRRNHLMKIVAVPF